MPSVRIIRKIIATLLAAQLSVVFGLCGGVCCLTARNAAAAEAPPQSHSHTDHNRTFRPAAAKGHCHHEAGKTGQVSAIRVERPQPAHHHTGNVTGRTIALAGGQHCRCSVSGQESQPTSSAQTGSPAHKDKDLAVGPPSAWQYADPRQPSPSVSPPSFHAPPFSGSQLHLRI
jgi:hypothetical protein